MTNPSAVPFGDPRRLIARQMEEPMSLPTRQDLAIVLCGGGDPQEEFARVYEMLALSYRMFSCPFKHPTVIAGNDQIAKFNGQITHAITLHGDKYSFWESQRRAAGFDMPERSWAHRPYSGISDWTRDWGGSTGLFGVKLARELGFVHIALCGVHMSPESGHFVRGKEWNEAIPFRRGWVAHLTELKPYVRSWGGWTREQFGAPTLEWLGTEIEDKHRQPMPPTYTRGQTA